MSDDHRISPLGKAQMQYRYPPGITSGDDPTKRGVPDSSLLNRHEWYEVLYFINKFANDCGAGSAAIASKAERLLHTKVPSNLHSHVHIRDWLIKNWQMHD